VEITEPNIADAEFFDFLPMPDYRSMYRPEFFSTLVGIYWYSGLNSLVYLTRTATEDQNGYCTLSDDSESSYKVNKAYIEYGVPEYFDHLQNIGIDNQLLPAKTCERFLDNVLAKHHVKKDLLLVFTTCEYYNLSFIALF
jgi:hypothetical protein